MEYIKDKSIDLMVTSPPYPMIEMWDEIFSEQNPEIKTALANKHGNRAFELMHKELDKVWNEVFRVLKNGGFACINIGDATRKLDDRFRLYSNHSRILQHCIEIGFEPMPEILWRKQTNAPNKFMGSGMLPAGAYVTLEHEFILMLRKDGKRNFKTEEDKLNRQKSAYFWEERNNWFSDVWEGLKGTRQNHIDKAIRERSGAYPFELAYRLINMFSVRGDTVLDPFLGTATTTIASMVAGRNSIGIEIDKNFRDSIIQRIDTAIDTSKEQIENRLKNHLEFMKQRSTLKGEPKYTNSVYGFPVMTRQELELTLDEIETIEKVENEITVTYKMQPTTIYRNNEIVTKNKSSLHNWVS